MIRIVTIFRINTGAPVPPDADAEGMVERLVRSTEDGEEKLEVEILTEVTPGQDMVILDISGVFIKMVQTPEVMLKGVMVTSIMLHSVIIWGRSGNMLRDPSCEAVETSRIVFRAAMETTIELENVPRFPSNP